MVTTANFNAWAAKYNTRKVVLVEMTVKKISDGSTVDLFFCDDPDRNGVWDSSHYYEPIIKTAPVVTHRIQDVTSGISLVSYGSLQLATQPGRTIDPGGVLTIDTLVDEYAFYGQPITVKIGSPDLGYADFATILTGYMDRPTFTDLTVDLVIKGNEQKVTKAQMPPNVFGNDTWDAWTATTAYVVGDFVSPTTGSDTYFECTSAGTSGASEPTWPTTAGATENDDSVTWTCRVMPDSTIGKARPITYGWCNNVAPVLIDEAAHIYQVHDPSYGPIEGVTAVYINGVAKATPADYALSADKCTITMTAAVSGQLTADLKGRKVGGAFVDLPGAVLKDVLTTFGGVASGDIDSAAFAAFDSDVPFPITLNVVNPIDVQSVGDSLLTSLTSFWGGRRTGEWFVKRFMEGAGAADLELIEDPDIIANSFSSEAETRLHHRVTISGDRNYTLQANPDTAVTEDRRGWLASGFRERSAEDSALLMIYPLADAGGPHQTHLKTLADCVTVAGWWLDLFGEARQIVRLSTKLRALQVELGDVVKITRYRFGFDGGKLGVLVGIIEDYSAGLMNLEVWL